jgi:subtilisin family serine protease
MYRKTGYPLLPRCSRIGVLLIVSGLLVAGVGRAEPPIQTLERAIERSVLDAEVVDAVLASGRARILAVFAAEPGAPISRRPDAARDRLARTAGYTPGPRYRHVPALAGSVDARALAALVADPHVLRVSLERVVTAQLSEAVPLVRLDLLRAGGFTGDGESVAIVDTGVDSGHPDLAGSVIDEQCFCNDGEAGPFGCCPDGKDEQGGAGAAQDDHGHGTRVAGIVASGGVHAPLGGAPDAALIAVKVLDASGGGFVSDLLSGLDWVRQNHPGIAVLNMSLGFGLYSGDCDAADANTMAFATAVSQLRATGTLVVAGSGNNGSGTSMIAPACVADTVSVGAVWDAEQGSQTWFGCTDATTQADQVTCWSNNSATTDLVAPGARTTTSQLGGTSTSPAGTSYATPVVSSCAAVLMDAYPAATPASVEAALTSTAVSVTDPKNGLSYPRLDCAAAFLALPEPGTPLSLLVGFATLARLARGRESRPRADRP